MKPRKVMINLEVLTDAPINHLRNIKHWKVTPKGFVMKLHQVSAQVVKGDK